MKTMHYVILAFSFMACGLAGAGEQGRHLLILSGQSNMNGKVRERDIIKPMVEKKFGKDSVIAVRHAAGGSSIAFWLEKTINADGIEVSSPGTVYPKWMESVKAASKGENIASVTFIWMQGESDVLLNKKPDWQDGKPMSPEIYRKNFFRLLKRVHSDLGVEELNVVIGRLSDYHKNEDKPLPKEKKEAWVAIRELQVKLAEELPSGAWVDTDDLNDGLQTRGGESKEVSNDLHYTDKGYEVFSERLAEASIKLIRQTVD